MLNEFRHQVRTDLRGLVATGAMPENTVALLKAQLATVRQALRRNQAG